MNNEKNTIEEKFYMNPETGAVDTLDGWHPYKEENGLILVVKNKNGDWVEA